MLETWVWEQHLIEIGDIHITMDDLHRTVHILHIICIHILHDANDLEYMTGSMLTRIVNIEPVFSLSRHFHVGATENDERNWFMVEQRRMTREIGLVWCEIASAFLIKLANINCVCLPLWAMSNKVSRDNRGTECGATLPHSMGWYNKQSTQN